MPTLTHQGAALHYEIHGTAGPPLLLIQGVGVAGLCWKPQTDDLANAHRLLSFDNRGIGGSAIQTGARLTIEQMADDARALMDAAGWDSCHVAGHSMGGVIAQRLALTHPDRVRSLALLCTVARGRDAVRFTPQTLWTAVRMSVGNRPARRRAFLELLYPKTFLATADGAALAAEVAAFFGHDLAEQPPVAMKQAFALRRHDCHRELSRLRNIPTLVVSAAHDPIAPPRLGRQLAGLIPDARYVEFADASHGMTIQHAAELNRLLASWVSSSETEQPRKW